MNILKGEPNNFCKKILATLGILSLFCYLFFGLNINIVKTEAQQTPRLDTAGSMGFSSITSGPIPGGVPQTDAEAQQAWNQREGMPQSSVLTPSSVPPNAGDAVCGINVSSGLWNYCMLAPVNGLLGGAGSLINPGGAGITEKITISDNSLQVFFANIYQIGIAVVIALAIVVISLGGIRLATTDSISGTDEGKKMVNAAFAGLFLALFSYVLLYTINPSLLDNGAGTIFPANTIPIKPPTPLVTPQSGPVRFTAPASVPIQGQVKNP